MVAVAQTIIDIDAVMIEFLHASIADHAVKSSRWLDDLAVEAEILQINIPVMAHLKQINDTEVSPDITWVRTIADQIKDHWQEKENYT